MKLTLALALAFIAGAMPLSAPASEPAGRLHFDLAPCSGLAEHPKTDVSVEAWFENQNGKRLLDRKLKWNATTQKHFVYDVDLPAGFYHYAVVALYDDKSLDHVVCDQQLYAAVLPGKTHAIEDTMEDGVNNPITPILLAGLLPKGVTAWIVRYENAPPCGTLVAPLQRNQINESEVQQSAYYGYDVAQTAKPNPSGVFGLELGWPDDTRRVVRLTGTYPTVVASGRPSSIRFDVTPDIASRIRSAPAGTLVCVTRSKDA